MAKIQIKLSELTKQSMSSTSHNQEMAKIIKMYLAPHVVNAKETIDKAVTTTASKLKSWATQKRDQAQKSGESIATYEKVLANPIGIATQIAHSMIVPVKQHSVQNFVQPKPKISNIDIGPDGFDLLDWKV